MCREGDRRKVFGLGVRQETGEVKGMKESHSEELACQYRKRHASLAGVSLLKTSNALSRRPRRTNSSG
ncbi:MAG: hypothetical protein ACI835_005823 [Planctomycetota bacterium]|jgi:hypothetical protein